MNEMLKAALAYAERGWYVLPIKPNEKVPLTKHGVKDATTDPKIIKGWLKKWPTCNIAIDVGRSGMLVYDMDPGSSIKELNEVLDGNLPKTGLESSTPRDGTHLFYALDKTDIVPSSAGKISPHVDVRSENGYVLLPPSKTKAGNYIWVSEGKAAHRTDEMVQTAYTSCKRSEDHDTWIIEPDIPENVKLAIEWLTTKAKLAIQGEGGDQCTYDTGCMMKSYGMSQAKALELMLEHWNDDCIPSWDYDELEVKVEHSYYYNTSQPGNVTPIYKVAKKKELFTAQVSEDKNGLTTKHFRIVNRTGAEDTKEPDWLLEDFLPEKSYGMMYGAYSTFKSFIALDIALSIVTGGLSKENLWGKVKFGNTLFALGEGRAMFVQRMRAWEHVKMNGHLAHGIFLCDPVPRITDELEEFIEASLTLNPDGYKLVVIDTVGRAMQGMNENAQENASAFTAMVEAMQKEFNCAVLALHHTGKSNTGPRGSSVFSADADAVIALERNPSDYTVAMTMEKQKDFAIWEKPRHLVLKEVVLSETVKSLVPVAHTPLKQTDEKEQTKGMIVNTHITDEIVYETLSENKVRMWTQTSLIDVILTDDRMDDVGVTTVKGYLAAIKQSKSKAKSRTCYDSKGNQSIGKWGWSNRANSQGNFKGNDDQ